VPRRWLAINVQHPTVRGSIDHEFGDPVWNDAFSRLDAWISLVSVEEFQGAVAVMWANHDRRFWMQL
jgi:hypothetical protein